MEARQRLGTVVADLAVKQQTLETLALPETDIAPKDDSFQWESPFPGVIFRGHVSFREGNDRVRLKQTLQTLACFVLYSIAGCRFNMFNLN